MLVGRYRKGNREWIATPADEARIVDGLRAMPGQVKVSWQRPGVCVFGSSELSFAEDLESGVRVFASGSIYDYPEATGRSVSERFLKSYLHRGEDFLSDLDADFSLLLVDSRRDTLLLARDPFGLYPLYVSESATDLYFASEPEQLVVARDLVARPDPGTVIQWLAFRMESAATFLEGIKQVPPGHLLLCRSGRISIRRYFWPIIDSTLSRAGVDDAADALASAVSVATASRLRSVRRSFIHLSGGLDSCFVAFAAKVARGSLNFDLPNVDVATVSCRFFGETHDEGGAIEAARSHLPFSSFEWDGRMVDDLDLTDPLIARPGGRRYLNCGPGDLSLVSAQGVEAVLAGIGGDELFIGHAAWVSRPSLRIPKSLLQLAYGASPALPGQRFGQLRFLVQSYLPDAAVRAAAAASARAASVPYWAADETKSVWNERCWGWLDGSSDLVGPGPSRAVWRRLIHPRLWHEVNGWRRMYRQSGALLMLPLLSPRVVTALISLGPHGRRELGVQRRLERRCLARLAPQSVVKSRRKPLFGTEIARYVRANEKAIRKLFSSPEWAAAAFVRREAAVGSWLRLLRSSKDGDRSNALSWWQVKSMIQLEAWLRGLGGV